MLLVVGCASPAPRIRRHAELFASFPPEVQENIRQGQIDVGYTKPMVYMALGCPHRIYDRCVQGTNVEIWAYTSIRYATDLRPIGSGYWCRDAHGRWRWFRDSYWLDFGQPTEYEVLRVEFNGDTVGAIERLRR